MVDDPNFSKTLGKFRNRVEGGLIQGSANIGMLAPKRSLLISSNYKEVERGHFIARQSDLNQLCI